MNSLIPDTYENPIIPILPRVPNNARIEFNIIFKTALRTVKKAASSHIKNSLNPSCQSHDYTCLERVLKALHAIHVLILRSSVKGLPESSTDDTKRCLQVCSYIFAGRWDILVENHNKAVTLKSSKAAQSKHYTQHRNIAKNVLPLIENWQITDVTKRILRTEKLIQLDSVEEQNKVCQLFPKGDKSYTTIDQILAKRLTDRKPKPEISIEAGVRVRVRVNRDMVPETTTDINRGRGKTLPAAGPRPQEHSRETNRESD